MITGSDEKRLLSLYSRGGVIQQRSLSIYPATICKYFNKTCQNHKLSTENPLTQTCILSILTNTKNAPLKGGAV